MESIAKYRDKVKFPKNVPKLKARNTMRRGNIQKHQQSRIQAVETRTSHQKGNGEMPSSLLHHDQNNIPKIRRSHKQTDTK